MTPDPSALSPIQAVVLAGATETSYRRAGSGPVVLVLLGDGETGPLREALLSGLSAGFRVIVPAPPEPPPADVAGWLRDVVDGLGLARPDLVVDGVFTPAALAFAVDDPDRVGRLAIVSGSAGGGEALEDVLGRSGHPMLLLPRRAGEDAAAVARTAIFLRAGTGATGAATA